MKIGLFPKIIFLVFFVFVLSAATVFSKTSVLTEESQKWLDQNIHKVTFSPEKDFPPMIWSQYETLFGVSNDYFNYMQQLIDARFNVREARSLNDILISVKSSGEKTIISSVSMTPGRSEYLIFTRPYFSAPAIFISDNSKSINGSEIESRSYSVAVGNNYGVHEYLKDRYPKMKLITFDNDYLVVQAILDKKVDYGAIDIASLMYLLKEHNIDNISKVGDTGFIYNFSFAVPKDMPELKNILDEAISKIPQSFQDSILEKWGVDYRGIQRIINQNSEVDNPNLGFNPVIIISGFVFAILVIIIVEYELHKYFFYKMRERNDKINK